MIKMFGTANDTGKWAVAVDGRYGLYDTKAEAEAVYATIGGYDGDDGAADTPFGAALMLAPGFAPKYRDGWQPEGGVDLLSQHEPCDIAAYINSEWTAARKPVPPPTPEGLDAWLKANPTYELCEDCAEVIGKVERCPCNDPAPDRDIFAEFFGAAK